MLQREKGEYFQEKMKKEDQKIVILTAKQILLYLADFTLVMHQIFDKGRVYRRPMKYYWKWRELDRIRFSQEVYKLKRQKLITVYREGKDKYIELTATGLEKLKHYQIDEIKIEIPKIWDQKWRMVIFDVPEDKKTARDILREKLRRLGFIQLQESVFIYPFECKREMDYISENYYIKPYVKYIVADFFEGDEEIIERFLDENILSTEIIKAVKRSRKKFCKKNIV